MMRAASDIFLGWTKGIQENHYLYWRQLRDMKGAMLTAAVPFTFAAVFRLRSIGHLALHPGSPP